MGRGPKLLWSGYAPVTSAPVELFGLLKKIRYGLKREIFKRLLESPERLALGQWNGYGIGSWEKIRLGSREVTFYQITGAAAGFNQLLKQRGYSFRIWASCRIRKPATDNFLLAVGLVDVSDSINDFHNDD